MGESADVCLQGEALRRTRAHKFQIRKLTRDSKWGGVIESYWIEQERDIGKWWPVEHCEDFHDACTKLETWQQAYEK